MKSVFGALAIALALLCHAALAQEAAAYPIVGKKRNRYGMAGRKLGVRGG